jgi:hypothetical protein
MSDREYPMLGLGAAYDAYPDIKVGPVVKAFPDIKVGDVLKVDGTALDLGNISRDDDLDLLVLEAEGSGGLRIAQAYGDSRHKERLTELMNELGDAAGTLNLTVLDVEHSILICEVVDVQSAHGEPQA